MIKFLVVCTSCNPAYKPKYRLFSTETKAQGYVATLPPTTSAEIILVREDAE